MLKCKGLWVRHIPMNAALLQSPDVVDVCLEHFQAMSGLYLWLVDVQDTMLASS